MGIGLEVPNDEGFFHRKKKPGDQGYERYGKYNYDDLTKVEIQVVWDSEDSYNTGIVGENAQRDSSAPNGKQDGGSGGSALALSECIQSYTKQETLTPGNEWYCRNCKAHVLATKKMDIYRLPDILVVQLKRFNFRQFYRSQIRDRIDTLVDFPLQGLDMSPYVTDIEGRSQLPKKSFATSTSKCASTTVSGYQTTVAGWVVGIILHMHAPLVINGDLTIGTTIGIN